MLATLCKICNARRPRRYCPGVHGDICSICCGTQREVTVSCPLDCPYLREAHEHEKPREIDERSLPNQDIRVTDAFLREHEALFVFMIQKLVESGLETDGVVDSDVAEALESLIRTYKTRESGLVYDSRPENPLARRVYDRMQESIREMEEAIREETGSGGVRDSELLGVIAFLQQLEIRNSNGRPKGRAFLDFLRVHFPPPEKSRDERLII